MRRKAEPLVVLNQLKKISPAQKKSILMTLLVFVVIAGFAYWQLHKSASSSDKGRPDGKPLVTIEKVQQQDLIRPVVLTGKVTAQAEVPLSAKYGAKVSEVRVNLGQAVQAGEVLLVQEAADVAQSLTGAVASQKGAEADAQSSNAAYQSGYQKAQADYNTALTTYGRYAQLLEQGAVAQEALDQKKQALDAAQAALDSWRLQMSGNTSASVSAKQYAAQKAQSDAAVLQQKMDDMVIRAPLSGTISYRQVEPGQFVTAGQTLLILVDNSQFNLDCWVPEQDAAQLSIGQSLNIAIDALGRTVPGQIIFVSPSADSKTMMYQVRLSLKESAGLKSGLFAKGEAQILLRPQTISLPIEAVKDHNGQMSVFVLMDKGIVEERTVQLGLKNDSRVEILSGLQVGEQVVTSNISRLKTGMAVKVGEGQ